MSLFQKKTMGKPPTLADDIPKAADWLAENMARFGYPLDGTVESFRVLDRFFEDQCRPGGLLDGKVGRQLFAIGSYMGQVFCKCLGGKWETDDTDPMGEINILVRLPDGVVIWPVQRAMKRYEKGREESLYGYGMVIAHQREVGSDQ